MLRAAGGRIFIIGFGLNFIKYIKMNEESRPDDYQPGDYIDYCFTNAWVVKLILAREPTPSLDDNLRVRDPRTIALAAEVPVP